ncbi:HET domain-containing protein [Fusarium sp. LHS14.1]|nr:HET domain-containing protein [Fusarium sp. LHS14.1]
MPSMDSASAGCCRGCFLLEPVKDTNMSLTSQSLSQGTGSQKTLSLAKRWVQQCATHHKRCNKPADGEPWYPTRLLSFDLNEKSIVRLIDTGQTRPDGKYITLTHRWGPPPIDHIVLTKDTYPQLLGGVPLSALPQGKDNAQDWQHEALLMKDVYSNSFCNISAADAADPSQSIFNHRDHHGLPPSLSTSSDAAFKQLNSFSLIGRVGWYKGRQDDGNSAPHLLWLRIVELYTDSALTVPSDKLIACSGIAERMAGIVKDDYVAGMWRRYLEGELLWVAHGNHQPGRCTRPREYRAPTWSWASIDGPVTPGEPRIQDSLIIVQDYHLDYQTDDKTAAIRGGWLRLRGVLRKTTLKRKVAEGYYWDMLLDGEKVNTQEETPPINCEPRVMLDILQEDFDQENAQGLLFSMCARSKNEEGRGMYILLLKMVQGEAGTFQRIGLVYAWSTKVKEWVLMRSPGEAQLPCLEYRDGLHSIRIV